MKDDMVTSLFYDKQQNIMTDEDFFPIYNIYQVVPPCYLSLFLKVKHYCLFEIRPNEFVELFYPSDNDDEFNYYIYN